jgi:hypothetical protein
MSEAGYQNVPARTVDPAGKGAEIAADNRDMELPEKYVGYDHAQNLASPSNWPKIASPTTHCRPRLR